MHAFSEEPGAAIFILYHPCPTRGRGSLYKTAIFKLPPAYKLVSITIGLTFYNITLVKISTVIILNANKPPDRLPVHKGPELPPTVIDRRYMLPPSVNFSSKLNF